MLVNTTQNYSGDKYLNTNNQTSFKRLEKICVDNIVSGKTKKLMKMFAKSEVVRDFCKENNAKAYFKHEHGTPGSNIGTFFEFRYGFYYKKPPKTKGLWDKIKYLCTPYKQIERSEISYRSTDEAERDGIQYFEFFENLLKSTLEKK